MSSEEQLPYRMYRGLANNGMGIGEGPVAPNIFGEQFFHAGSPLELDSNFLKAVRYWMTFDWTGSDYAELGEDIEGWSYSNYKQWRFVVRLCAGGEFDRRLAYFSQAWVWDENQFSNGFDPGVYIGNHEAFDTPWRNLKNPPTSKSLPPPLTVRPAQVLANPQLALNLLAHFYDSLANKPNVPVVLGADMVDFRIGGPLSAIVSFVRTAIPLHLKRDCRIRILTHTPSFFLDENTNILVLQANDMWHILRYKPNAILLNRKGLRLSGRAPSDAAVRYAEWMLTCFSKPELQNLLPACTEQISKLWGTAAPSLKQVDTIPDIYKNLL